MATTKRKAKAPKVPMGKVCEACGCCFSPYIDGCPRCEDFTVRFKGMVDMFDAIRVVDWQHGGLRRTDDSARCTVGYLQTEGAEAMAKSLGIPVVAAFLLHGWDVDVQALDEWNKWPQRSAFLRALAEYEAQAVDKAEEGEG